VQQLLADPRSEAAGLEAADQDPTTSRWGFEPGNRIAPELSAIKLLGGGYRYEAYLAWSERLRSLVVTKVVRPGLVEDERTLRGLADEVEFLERLSHPVLVRSFGHELEGTRPHLVLEHLEGPRLSTLLRRYGPLQPEQLLPLALQLCAGIHYLEREGVVHLDVKPSNIIMGGPPRLIDLSVARTIEQCASLRSPVGTDAYMAPEQCLASDGATVGSPADVWGIGATLFRAAAGKRAFSKGDPDSAVPERRWPQLVEEPGDLYDSAPATIAEPVMRCLAREPKRRPAPGEVAEALELVLDDLPGPKISRLKPRIRR
jgi:eukaryotic-like serine/threonine-protein kinase